MKIEPNGDEIQRIEQVRAVRPTRAASATQGAGSVQRPDQAEFSNRGVELAKARAALSGVPEVREERVTALRDQIKAGSYQVPYDALAQTLMRAVTL